MHVTILQFDMKEHRNNEVQMGDRHPTRKELQEQYRPAWIGELGWFDVGRAVPMTSPERKSTLFLRALWRTVEKGGPDCPIPRVMTEDAPIRSFHVGDIVLLDGEPYVCDSHGWSEWEPGKRMKEAEAP